MSEGKQQLSVPVKDEESENPKYRSFIFVLHEVYGMLLLHCTRKKKKGPHYQIPGGHMDNVDFTKAMNILDTIESHVKDDDAIKNNMASTMAKERQSTKTTNAIDDTHIESSVLTPLQIAGKIGAVRELHEETGIDLRAQLDRVRPLKLYYSTHDHDDDDADANYDNTNFVYAFKNRLFYIARITDDDLKMKNSKTSKYENSGIGDSTYEPFTKDDVFQHVELTLSDEHSGFRFEKNRESIHRMIQSHSGGTIAKAFVFTNFKSFDSKSEVDQFDNLLQTRVSSKVEMSERDLQNNEEDDDDDDDDDEA